VKLAVPEYAETLNPAVPPPRASDNATRLAELIAAPDPVASAQRAAADAAKANRSTVANDTSEPSVSR
jgi:hypothetical protein